MLQHTATHCNTLQHTATHCNTLQHTGTNSTAIPKPKGDCNTLQYATTNCKTLQHTATHCNTLQHAATRKDDLNTNPPKNGNIALWPNTHVVKCRGTYHKRQTGTKIRAFGTIIEFVDSQSALSPFLGGSKCHCNTLQHTAAHCNTLQHAAKRKDKLNANIQQSLQYAATHCNTLQRPATRCNIL